MTSTPTRRRLAVRLAGTSATVVVALCSLVGFGAPPAASATHSIVIKQYAYTPRAMSLGQGDTVTWTNQDSVPHDVTVTRGPSTFHSPMLAKGESWSHVFNTAGSYSYICSVHPDMVGSLSVSPRSTPAPRAPAAVPHTSTSDHAPGHTSTPATTRPLPATPPPAAQAAAPAVSSEMVAAPAVPESTLDPLLLVAGVSTAVTVFCLLLLTSRPARPPEEAAEPATGT